MPCHSVAQSDKGPFGDLPRDSNGLQWKQLSGTDGRYDAALSLSFSISNANTKQKCFISFHLRQNFWDSEAKGVNIKICYQIYSPDMSARLKADGPSNMLFEECTKGSWRILFDSPFNFGTDMLCRTEPISSRGTLF